MEQPRSVKIRNTIAAVFGAIAKFLSLIISGLLSVLFNRIPGRSNPK